MSEEIRATTIKVAWTDGLTQEFERQENGTWTLTLVGRVPGGPRISDYHRKDLERVLGRALEGTSDREWTPS